jgi:hypothetical protein
MTDALAIRGGEDSSNYDKLPPRAMMDLADKFLPWLEKNGPKSLSAEEASQRMVARGALAPGSERATEGKRSGMPRISMSATKAAALGPFESIEEIRQHKGSLGGWEPEEMRNKLGRLEEQVYQAGIPRSALKGATIRFLRLPPEKRSETAMRGLLISQLEREGPVGGSLLERQGISPVTEPNVVLNDVAGPAVEYAEMLGKSQSGYFETKIGRAVKLSEFSGAAVPEGDTESIAILKKHGIPVETYGNPKWDPNLGAVRYGTNDAAQAVARIADVTEARFAKRKKPEPTPEVPLPEPIIPTIEGYSKGNPPRVKQNVADLYKSEQEANRTREEMGLPKAPPIKPLTRDTPRRHAGPEMEAERRAKATEPDDYFYDKAARGEMLNDVESQLMDSRRRDKAEVVQNLATEVAQARSAGLDTGELNAKLLVAQMDHVLAASTYINDGSAVSRAMAARTAIMKAGRSVPDQFLERVLKEIPGVTSTQAAELMHAWYTQPEVLPDLLRAAMKPGMLSKIMHVFRAHLLSGFGTDIANASGNTVKAGLDVADTAGASGMDWMLQKWFGGQRERFAGEAGARLGGTLQGAVANAGTLARDLIGLAGTAADVVPGALSGAKRVAGAIPGRAGEIAREGLAKSGKEVVDPTRPLEYQVNPIGGKYGRLLSTAFDKMGVADKFFRNSGGLGDASMLALRQASKELPGAGKAEIASKSQEILSKMISDAPGEYLGLVREVERMKPTHTWQEKPGELIQSLTQMVNRHPWLGIVFPFIRTPSNIARDIVRHSPAGFIEATQAYKKLRAAHAEFSAGKMGVEEFSKIRGEVADVMAKPIIGTIILGSAVAAAKMGLLTGSGPTDPKDASLKRESGWQPYSFVLDMGNGEKAYVPFTRLEPVASLFGFAADLHEMQDAKKSGDMFTKAIGSVVHNLTSKTYLQGLADASTMLSRPQEAAGKYFGDVFKALVTPNIVAKAAQAIDPTVRDTTPSETGVVGAAQKWLVNPIAARIPGVSTMLPAKMSGIGEEITRPGNAITRFLLPVQPSATTPEADIVNKLVDLGVVPGAPERTLSIPGSHGRKVELTDTEVGVMARANATATEEVKRLVETSRFRAMDAEDQKAEVEKVFSRHRQEARKKLYSTSSFARRARQVLAMPA